MLKLRLNRARPVVGGLLVGGILLLAFQISRPVSTARQSNDGGEGDIIWSAGHESGDLTEWNQDQGGSVFNTGTGQVTVVNTVAHRGCYALELTIDNSNGQPQAARIFRWHENLKEAYYSAWFFFPRAYKPKLWWNVFQFKSTANESKPMWVLNVRQLATGDMVFYLWDAINQQTYDINPSETRTIPVGEWTHVEAYYRRATDQTGRITIWQDGTKLIDLNGVQTAIADNVQWSLANYTDQITPSKATLYVDDAVISRVRIGTNEAALTNISPSSTHKIFLPLIFKRDCS
jgi:hypothetical protein